MKHVFLLGAGFTRAVTEEVMGNKALLASEILPKLNLSGFSEIIEDYEKTPDIEQFITRLDLKCLRFEKSDVAISKRLNEIRNDIVEQIVKMFDVSTLSVDSLDNFLDLKRFIGIIPAHSTILTLNYDLVLDQGLYLSKRWDPGEGYYVKALFGEEGAEENKKLDNILLLKLHGSCNFRDSTGNPQLFNIEITDKIFPGIGINSCEQGTSVDKGPHVLVMSYLKIYHKGIMKLWKKAIEDLTNADRLTIIGCSLREEDTFLRYALYHFGRRPDVSSLLVEIADVKEETCKDVELKIRSLLPWPRNVEVKKYSAGLKDFLAGRSG